MNSSGEVGVKNTSEARIPKDNESASLFLRILSGAELPESRWWPLLQARFGTFALGGSAQHAS